MQIVGMSPRTLDRIWRAYFSACRLAMHLFGIAKSSRNPTSFLDNGTITFRARE